MNERQLTAIAKIDTIRDLVKQMNEGKDVSNIAKKLLNAEFEELKLQIIDINLSPYAEVKTNEVDDERKLIDDRLFNYYFIEGTEVILDDKNITIKDSDFNPYKLEQYIGKKGVVTRCASDMHAFGQGSSYVLDVDFDGEKLENIVAFYFVEYKK